MMTGGRPAVGSRANNRESTAMGTGVTSTATGPRTLHTQRSLSNRKAWISEMSKTKQQNSSNTPSNDKRAAHENYGKTRSHTVGYAPNLPPINSTGIKPPSNSNSNVLRGLRSPTQSITLMTSRPDDDSDDSIHDKDRTLTNNTPKRPHSLFSKLPTKTTGFIATSGSSVPSAGFYQQTSQIPTLPSKSKNRDRSSSLGRLESPILSPSTSTPGFRSANYAGLSIPSSLPPTSTTSSVIPSSTTSATMLPTTSTHIPQSRHSQRIASSNTSQGSAAGVRPSRSSKSPSTINQSGSDETTGFMFGIPRILQGDENHPPTSGAALSRSNSSKASSNPMAFPLSQDFNTSTPDDSGASGNYSRGELPHSNDPEQAFSHTPTQVHSLYQAENERLRETVKSLENALERERSERESLTQEASRLLSVEFRRHTEIQRLEDEMDSLTEENRHLRHSLTELRSGREEIDGLKSHIEALQQENTRLSSSMTNPEDAERLLNHIEALESENQRLTAASPIGPSQQEVHRLKHHVSELELHNQQLDSSCQELQANNLKMASDRLKFKDDVSQRLTEMENEFTKSNAKQQKVQRDLEKKLEDASSGMQEKTIECEHAQRRRATLARTVVQVWRQLVSALGDQSHWDVPIVLEEEASLDWATHTRLHQEPPEGPLSKLAKEVLEKMESSEDRIRDLSQDAAIISRYRDQIEALERSLEEARSAAPEYKTRVLRLQTQVKILQQTINDLLSANQLVITSNSPMQLDKGSIGHNSGLLESDLHQLQLTSEQLYSSGTQTPVPRQPPPSTASPSHPGSIHSHHLSTSGAGGADLSALDDETLHLLAGTLAKEDARVLESTARLNMHDAGMLHVLASDLG